MQEEQQDRLIEESASRLYRPSAHPPLDEMWSVIEAREWGRPPRSTRRWFTSRSLWLGTLAAAACLVIGFTLGKTSGASRYVATPRVAAVASDSIDTPYDRTATALLGETVVLLRALPASRSATVTNERFASQATDLLVTTRLLMDSPAATDPRLHELLQDLELVLAQIARLHNGKSQTELDLITEAVAERDIVPRIRRVAAELATSDN